MPHVMALRSRKTPPKKTEAVKDEDAALISSEERMMEDEEIESVDEFGNPIVDMGKLENRNLSVAMTRSAADMSGGDTADDIDDDDNDDTGGESRCGLRTTDKSSPPVSPRSTGSASPRRRSDGSTEPEAITGSIQVKTEPMTEVLDTTTITPSQPLTSPPSQPIASPPLLKVVPLVKPTPLPTLPVPPLQRPPRFPMVAKPPEVPLKTVHTSHGVPNPLANLATPLKQEPLIPPVISSLPKVKEPCVSTPFQSTVPCPLSAVPCPLAAPVPPAPKVEVMPVPAFAQPINTTSEFSSTDLLPRRGRIFSMDIDADGLDFPDMSVDNIASDFGHSPGLPPLGHPQQHYSYAGNQQQSQPLAHPGAPIMSAPIPMSAPSAMFAGRDRAMSFEFFSLGINADEPLPESSDALPPCSDEGYVYQQRPRGDSIIFDPVSFQDGGIHEEKALFRSRANSIDMPSKDEMAIMNAPGFVAPSVAPPKPILHKPMPASFRPQTAHPKHQTQNSAQIATLPSSLNTTMNHATFQMDLLNKDGRIGIYLPDARKARIAKFHSKRKMRIWRKRIKYDCRKKLADSRPRIKGRFVKRSDMDED